MFPFRQFFYDRYRDIETAEHRLLYLFLEVTRRCNLSCRHCGSDCGSDDRGPVLSPESWFSIVDYVSARFSKDLVFVVTGGEPLIWPHLAALGRRIQGNGRRWGMVTNGHALDARTLADLCGAGLGSITISLDGCREAHNYLRNDGRAFDRTMVAIDLAGGSAIPMKDVVTCVHPGNLDDLPPLARILLDRRIPRWRLFRIFPRGRAALDPGLILDRGQCLGVIEWIRRNRRIYRKAGLTVDWSCEGWLPFALDRRVRSEPYFCRAGIQIASILCDGTVTGCPNNGPMFHAGHVARGDFARIWENGFDRLRDRTWMRKGRCVACRHFPHCRGGSAHLWDDAADSPSFCLM